MSAFEETDWILGKWKEAKAGPMWKSLGSWEIAMASFKGTYLPLVQPEQCDQIGRFFALWSTIQSWWQQLFYPNWLHCQAIFVKGSKSFIFLVKSYMGNFYRHLAIFIWSHWSLCSWPPVYLDWIMLLFLCWMNSRSFYLFGQIQTSQTGCQPCSDTSHYDNCSLSQPSTKDHCILSVSKLHLSAPFTCRKVIS